MFFFRAIVRLDEGYHSLNMFVLDNAPFKSLIGCQTDRLQLKYGFVAENLLHSEQFLPGVFNIYITVPN